MAGCLPPGRYSGRAWHLRPAEEMLKSLKDMLGPDNVWLVHGRPNRDLKEGAMV